MFYVTKAKILPNFAEKCQNCGRFSANKTGKEPGGRTIQEKIASRSASYSRHAGVSRKRVSPFAMLR